MNNYLKLLGLALFATGSVANAAPPQRMNAEELSSSITKRLSQNGRQWRKAASPTGMKKVVTETETNTQPSSTWGSINTRDGEEWMYTIDYSYAPVTEYSSTIESAYITVYNPKFEVVKSFTASFELAENETSINQVELVPTLSKKFFNVDDNYEVMLFIHATTVDYSGHCYTQVFSLGTGDLLTTLEGYNVGAIDNSADSWSEDYVMAFLREDIEFKDDGDMDYFMHFDIYGKSGYTGGCRLLHTFDVDYELFSGAGNYALPILMNNHDKKMYYALPRYEKPFFAGVMTDEITPDNNFIIDLYNENFELVKTTTIPMETEDGALFSFPGMGELTGNTDLDFELFSDGNEPMYIIGNENYIPGSDDFITSLYVYDTDGQMVKKIIENCDNYIGVSDVNGYDPQWCFYFENEETGGEYQFVNLPSCTVSARIPVIFNNNIVTTEIDRVSVGDSYQYVSSLAYGDADSKGNTYHSMAWFNPDGSHNHTDEITLGKDIAYALPYVAGFVLDPYLLNTDDNVEYMFLVKEYVDLNVSSETREYLRVYSDNELILNLGPNTETNEVLSSIFFINTTKNDPKLVIAYYGPQGYTLHSLALPLSKFAGGKGTVEDPYLIATVGDLKTMYAYPEGAYKLVADIDFNGASWEGNKCDFKGVLDGDNHTISNLTLSGAGIFNTVSNSGVVKNLNIENVTVDASKDATGIVCGQLQGLMSNGSHIDNVHIKNVVAKGNNVTFGGIAGQSALRAAINNCSVTHAYYDFNNGSTVGGLIGFMSTGTAVSGCLFDGTIIANTAGGIVGGSMSADETITNCHALVNIQGGYAAGGIIGDSGRSIVTNCFVDGTVKADGVKTAGAGGIVGVVAAPYTTDKTGMVVMNCVVSANVSATVSEAGERNVGIAHRVIGFTSGDGWIVDWDSNDPSFNPSDPSTYPYIKDTKDYNFANNFALGVEKIDANSDDAANSTEGKTITTEELNDEFLAEHGFSKAIWKKSLSALALADETYNIIAEDTEIRLSNANGIDGTPAIAVFHLDRLYADKVEIELESTNAVQLGEINVSADGYTIECEVYCIGNGVTELVATLGEKRAVVTLSTSSSNIDGIDDSKASLIYNGTSVKGEAEISIYNVQGICVARGYNEVSTSSLPCGIYIATDGTDTIKIKK